MRDFIEAAATTIGLLVIFAVALAVFGGGIVFWLDVITRGSLT